MFSYAIIASAVWLLQTSALVEVIAAKLKALKERLLPTRPPPEHPPPPGFVARLLARLKPTPKAPPPPVLGLVPRYATTAQHLAIICSFGAVYPPVAIVGTLKLFIDSYVMERQLDAEAKKSGGALVLEGMDRIASASVFAVLAFQTTLLFFVFGPFGLVKLPAASTLAVLAVIGGGIGVMLGPSAADGFVRHLARRQPSLNAMLLQEDLRTEPAAAEDFARAFAAWQEKEALASSGRSS